MPVPSSTRRTSLSALLLYTAFIVYQSLAQGGAWMCTGAVLEVGARISRSDMLANVVAYVPLGVLLVLAATRPWVGPSGRPPLMRVLATVVGATVAIGLLSLGMELVQACQAARVSSLYDLIANVTGGALGVGAGLALRAAPTLLGPRPTSSVSTPDVRLRLLTAAVALGWVVSQTMPWVFAVDVGTVRSNLSFLRHWADGAPLDAWRLLRHAGAWAAVGCACRLLARGRMPSLAAFVLTGGVSLALQLLLDANAPLSFEELAGMTVAGLVIASSLLVSGEVCHTRRWASALLLGAAVAVAAYELRPVPGAAVHTFSWFPRVGLGGLLGAIDYALLFGWFGLAAVVAARWADADGHPHARRRWPAGAILVTFLLEAAQTGIPGRGPDLSAPLFTVLAVLLAAAVLADGRGDG